VRLAVLPQQATIDTPIRIVASGCPPQQSVTLRASQTDHAGVVWTAAATFTATVDGVVDPALQAPVAGSYHGVDPAGLLWSMEPQVAGADRPRFALQDERPIALRLSVEVGDERAETTVERRILADGVTARDVRERGLVGRFFAPEGGGHWPAVLTYGGSGGGLQGARHVAPLVARHGFAVLALAYFALDTLPAELVEIPLEYFATAMDWLAAQPEVAGDELAVMGVSKGGELSLLLGATFPRVRAVVALVPSHVVHAGVGAGRQTERSSWSFQGRPLPFLPRAALDLPGDAGQTMEHPIALRELYEAALANRAAVHDASIPVEHINGPVLMVSGTDDGFWPSTAMADEVMERLAEHRHPHPSEHLAHPGAGHGAGGIPYLPTTITASKHPVRGLYLTSGGSPAVTARANAASWPRIVAFLSSSVGAVPRDGPAP
jgi:dienelactone hydrolase